MLDSGMAEQLLPVLKAVVARATARHAALVTGGTDAGVFHVLRLAVESSPHGPDHVIGVAPDGLVVPAGSAVPRGSKRAPMDPSLSVLVRVEGDQWGDETAVLSSVVAEIAGSEPAAMLLVGGGDVTRAELVEHLRRGRSIVVVEGTGRLADLLASGTVADDDADLRALVQAGDVQVVRLSSGPNTIAKAVTARLEPIAPLSGCSIRARSLVEDSPPTMGGAVGLPALAVPSVSSGATRRSRRRHPLPTAR